MEENRLGWPWVQIWRIDFKGRKTPIGRFVLDPRTRRVAAEAEESVARRALERIAREGVKDYDMSLIPVSEGIKFLRALRGGLAFTSNLRAGTVQANAAP